MSLISNPGHTKKGSVLASMALISSLNYEEFTGFMFKIINTCLETEHIFIHLLPIYMGLLLGSQNIFIYSLGMNTFH